MLESLWVWVPQLVRNRSYWQLVIHFCLGTFLLFVFRSFFAIFAFVAARAGATAARRGRLDRAARLGPSPRRTQKLKKEGGRRPSARASGRPGVRTSERPDVRASGRPGFRACERPSVRASGRRDQFGSATFPLSNIEKTSLVSQTSR